MIEWQTVSHTAEPESKQEYPGILISDKVVFKSKLVRIERRTSRMVKGTIHQKRDNNCEYVCSEYQCTQFHETKSI